MKAWNWMKGKYDIFVWPAFLVGAGMGTLVYGLKKFTTAMDRASEVVIVNNSEIEIKGGE